MIALDSATLADTIDVFVRGWARTRGDASNVVERHAGAWYVRLRTPSGAVHEEVLAPHGDAKGAVAFSRRRTLGPHWLTIFHGERDDLSGYVRQGYRLERAEALMTRDLDTSLPGPDDAVAVRRVSSHDERAWFDAWHRDSPVPPGVHEGTVVQYAVQDADAPAARARAAVAGDAVVVDSVLTLPSHRRRGLASALMRRLLTDAREGGYARCVLAASADGEQLYASIGFDVVARMAVHVRV